MVNEQASEQIKSRFYFVGNHLALDFINTQVIDNGDVVDLLKDFNDLVDWCREARIIARVEDEESVKGWAKEGLAQEELAQVFLAAIEFRRILRDMAQHIVTKQAIPATTIEAINKILYEGVGYEQLIEAVEGYEKQFIFKLSAPIRLLVPIAESAANLLSEGELTLVKKCENTACILYYYDSSKNHARRWCSMSICGNRAKAAAHYHKTKRESAKK